MSTKLKLVFAIAMLLSTSIFAKGPRVNLQVAIIQGNIKAVEQHIKAETDLNIKESTGGSTPLITACTFGKTEIAKALIDAGADLNIQNNDGSTALITASFFCRTEIVQYLLDAGANQTITNHVGSTAIQSVMAPFDAVKPIYEAIENGLKPLGFKLDYKHLEKTRPIIAEMLK